jgi:hypothetical protein
MESGAVELQGVLAEFCCKGTKYDYPSYWVDGVWVIAK